MNERMPNMKQIAQMADVSLGTVFSCIEWFGPRTRAPQASGIGSRGISGYQPSQLARGLRRDKTNMVGMIIPDLTNPFFPAVVRGAEDVAFSNGYRLILCNTDNDHARRTAPIWISCALTFPPG